MSSFLDKQNAAFRGSLASAAAKIGNPSTTKASLAPPSPSPSQASDNKGTPTSKRKRDVEPVYVPEPTSFGTNVLTQMTFAVEYLKNKNQPRTMTEIIGHLSLMRETEQHKRELAEGLRRHPRVEFTRDKDSRDQDWTKGTYAHRPIIPGVNSEETLLAHLQRKTDASGVSVKDLKDGWPDCEEAIQGLEDAHRILVVRTKKDNLPRYVWPNDPSLHYAVDAEFRTMWDRVPIPSLDDMHRKLVSVGQKPTSDDPRKAAVGTAANQKKQKKRAVKKIGKATNVHMAHLMQDYSGLRR